MPKYLLLFFGLVSFVSCSQKLEPVNKIEAIDNVFQTAFEKGKFNGTVIIQEGDSIIYQNALGVANIEANEPLSITSQFYLGSVAKQFTTMAVLILKERGELEFDTKLREVFPDFPDYAKEVTVRNLMTHTSGIADHFGLGAYKPGLNNDDVYSLLKQQDKLEFEPGEKYKYSNGAYVLLSMTVEKVSGQPYHEFMRENIFEPLGMHHTLIYDQSDPEVAERVTGYRSNGKLDDYEIYTLGAGGMYSNAPDIITWLRAVRDNKIVSKETMDDAFQPFTLNNGEVSNYGFGWGVSIEDDRLLSVSHSGSLNGFRTFDRWEIPPDRRIVILTSQTNDLQVVGKPLENILAGNKYSLP